MTDPLPADAPHVIEILDLHKAYGDLEVLKGVSISAKRGDVVSLIGSSGSGKSTPMFVHQISVQQCHQDGRANIRQIQKGVEQDNID